MVVNTDKLRGKVVEKRTTLDNVAKAAGMNRTTFYRKMKGNGENFTIGEIHKIVDAVPLTRQEAIDIFFVS